MATMTYEQTMAHGARQYADVTDAFGQRGLPAEFIQTGGMCAALMINLEARHYLLLTDLYDTLSWERTDHKGWWVGLHEHEERRTGSGPLRWTESADGSLASALELADQVLRPLRRP